MRLVSFLHGHRPGWGAVEGDEVLDLGAALPQHHGLKALLAADALDEAARVAHGAPRLPLAEVTFRPVIPKPDKILCVGINYVAHIEETGRERPTHPVIFTRWGSSQVGHGQPMLRPRLSERLDYEGEMALVIGRRGRYIPRERALEHVAGWSCYNDGSVRDWQRHTPQFTPGKNFPRTGGFGPWLLTRDEAPDHRPFVLTTRVNGQVLQQAPLTDLCFDVPALIAYCSSFTELMPGDVIVTGTPGGVGAFRDPPIWLKPGDLVEVQIEGLGTLVNTVEAEGPVPE